MPSHPMRAFGSHRGHQRLQGPEARDYYEVERFRSLLRLPSSPQCRATGGQGDREDGMRGSVRALVASGALMAGLGAGAISAGTPAGAATSPPTLVTTGYVCSNGVCQVGPGNVGVAFNAQLVAAGGVPGSQQCAYYITVTGLPPGLRTQTRPATATSPAPRPRPGPTP